MRLLLGSCCCYFRGLVNPKVAQAGKWHMHVCSDEVYLQHPKVILVLRCDTLLATNVAGEAARKQRQRLHVKNKQRRPATAAHFREAPEPNMGLKTKTSLQTCMCNEPEGRLTNSM